jgi:chloride channel 3/4/5
MLLCQVTEVMFTSGLTALVSYTIVYLRGSSMVLLSALFSECKHSSQDIFQELCNAENGRDILSFLLISAGFMMLMTIITFGNPAPGGVFVPTLVTGALMGRAVGFAMQLLENEMGDVGIFETCVSAEHCITPGWLASRLIHH